MRVFSQNIHVIGIPYSYVMEECNVCAWPFTFRLQMSLWVLINTRSRKIDSKMETNVIYISSIYDDLWYDLTEARTHDLPDDRRTR